MSQTLAVALIVIALIATSECIIRVGMTLSQKLGAASAFLLATTLIPPYSGWRFPINFACLGLSIVLALVAAHQGSKWWLTIPGLILGGVGFGLYLGFHSF